MTTSIQGKAAQAIRRELKAAGIKARVRSDDIKILNVVYIDLTNPTPEQFEQAKAIGRKYECGTKAKSEYRDGIPQVNVLMVQYKFTEDMRQQAWDIICKYCRRPPSAVNDKPYRIPFFGDMAYSELLVGAALIRDTRALLLKESTKNKLKKNKFWEKVAQEVVY